MANRFLLTYLLLACAAGVRIILHNGAILTNGGQLIRESPVVFFVLCAWIAISFIATCAFIVCNLRAYAWSSGLYVVFASSTLAMGFFRVLWAVKNHVPLATLVSIPLVVLYLLIGVAYLGVNVLFLVKLLLKQDVGSKLGIGVGMPDMKTFHRLGPSVTWGPLVKMVRANSLAHKAGIQNGDMILEVDGVAAASLKGSSLDVADGIASYFQNCAAGHTLKLLIRRESQEQLVVVQL